ncbi:uncharacterized protein LOC133349770 [Lethenteron reissneri]|uniref:uncharacterized protein LOC133349770 n=1 Tax=Lethenteron reissneri TaxID=7753 RepID=UPI002AB74581|nr:uncharacterized protein LOC133349770 [Lethenteron reissneri]XP_061419477.1 uncharacterized protein LOC133349770 [Lethenteron reissneri]
MENKRALIRERCREFPTLFNLDVPLGVIQVESAIAKLKREHECPNLAEEFGNELNLLNSLAYFYLRRNKYKDAKPLVEEALAKEPHSLTALANQCEMFLIQYKFPEAEKAVCAMEKESENKEAIVTALAEQGYCYSRMGPIAYMKAIAKFTQATRMGHGHCSADKMASWNFSIASNCSRIMAKHIVKEFPDLNINDQFVKGRDALLVVINTAKGALKAKAYIVLGEMTKIYFKDFMHRPLDYDTDRVMDVTKEMLTVSQCFELACKLGPLDHWVLERAGKHQRHRCQYEKALGLLRKAHSIYPTPFNLHQLGLTYNSLASNAYEKAKSREWRSQNQPRYDGNDTRREQEGCGTPNYGASGYKTSTTRGDGSATYRAPPDHFRRKSSQEQDGQYRERLATIAKENAASGIISPNFYFNLYANTDDPMVIENLDKAIKCIKDAVELSSERGNPLFVTLADIYTSLGKHEEADECFIKSLQQHSYIGNFSYALTYEKWGFAMKNRGEKEKSQDYFRMAIEHAAKAKVPVKVAFQCLMRDVMESQIPKPEQLRKQSELCQLMRRHQEALSLLWEADEQSPGNPDILSGLIKNLAAKRHYELARMYLAILQHTEGSDETIDPALQVEICFGAAKQNMDTLSLIGLRDTYECLFGNPRKTQEKSQDLFIFNANNSQADSQLAVHIQHLAKEVGQVECDTLDDQPAGTHLLDIMEYIVKNFDAVLIILTHDLIADDVSMKLCKYLVDRPCVLLCLCTSSVFKEQIPTTLRLTYQAVLPERLHGADFTENKDSVEKLRIWREIFDHLLAAKDHAKMN